MIGRNGYTLTEAMMAVVVAGILASLALPGYRKAMERGYLREAEDILLAVYHGERAHFFTDGAYEGPLIAGSPNWQDIHIDDPNLGAIPVQFSIGAGGATFTATAQRQGGPCNGMQRTIDETRTLAGNWPTCGAL